MFNDNGSFLLALFEFFLFFAWFMCLFWVLGDIFRSKDLGGGGKTFWIIFVILIPWLGILVYVIARGKGMQERQLEQAKEMQAAQTEYIKSVAASPASDASRPDHVRQVLARLGGHHPGRVRGPQGQGARHLTRFGGSRHRNAGSAHDESPPPDRLHRCWSGAAVRVQQHHGH